jgi:hypothetical protein
MLFIPLYARAKEVESMNKPGHFLWSFGSSVEIDTLWHYWMIYISDELDIANVVDVTKGI